MQELISGYVLLKSLVAIAEAIMQEALISGYILLQQQSAVQFLHFYSKPKRISSQACEANTCKTDHIFESQTYIKLVETITWGKEFQRQRNSTPQIFPCKLITPASVSRAWSFTFTELKITDSFQPEHIDILYRGAAASTAQQSMNPISSQCAKIPQLRQSLIPLAEINSNNRNNELGTLCRDTV